MPQSNFLVKSASFLTGLIFLIKTLLNLSLDTVDFSGKKCELNKKISMVPGSYEELRRRSYELWQHCEILSNNDNGNNVKTWPEMVDFLTALF